MTYVIVGLSHKTAPLPVRERVAISSDRYGEVLAGFLRSPEIREGMMISTCNRVEICLVSPHPSRAIEAAREYFMKTGGFQDSRLENCLYTMEGEKAVAHIFRVTASLDSMIVGEPQISGQVKEAYREAVAHEATGAYLNALVHRSLHVSKRIRRETAIAEYPVSVSYAAVVLASRIFKDLREKTVLVLGAGKMSFLAGRHLRERRAGKIYVANRSRENAVRLAKELEGEVVPLERVFSPSDDDLLPEIDILISSVAVEKPVLEVSHISRAMIRRKGRSMFLIDLGVPRNIDPAVNGIENVYLYTIDDLQGIVTANQKEREREARRAEGIIAEEVQRFEEKLREMRVGPTIKELSAKFERIRLQEVNKYFGSSNTLSAKDRENLEACTKGVVGKILHEPILLVKTEAARSGVPKYAEILKKLFRLEENE